MDALVCEAMVCEAVALRRLANHLDAEMCLRVCCARFPACVLPLMQYCDVLKANGSEDQAASQWLHCRQAHSLRPPEVADVLQGEPLRLYRASDAAVRVAAQGAPLPSARASARAAKQHPKCPPLLIPFA